jgi:transcriptional regulator with XRE-family HTH domain
MAASKASKKPVPDTAKKQTVAEKKTAAPEEASRARPRVTPGSGDELGAADVARRVADGLKHFRKIRGLSLDDLALRSGVSRAALSQIEGTRTNPTLSVLWKVAVGLDVPFHELLGVSEDGGAKVLRAGDTPPLKSGDGRMESRLLSPGGSPSDTEIYELRFLPKAVHRSEPHGRGTLETLVIMTGALRLLVEEAEYDLQPGDTIFFKADVQHVYENRSSHETRCFNVIRYQRDS